MITVPFVYFSFLAFFFYRSSRRIDLAVYISLIYAVSGFFSIFLDVYKLRSSDTASYEITLLPTIVYCLSLTACIYPIYAFSKAYHGRISALKSDSPLRTIALLGFVFAVFSIIMSMGSVTTVLKSDIGELRNDMYRGIEQETWMTSLPSAIRVPIALLNHVFGAPWVFIFLAFYALFVQKMPVKYGLMFLTVSFLGPVGGIAGADRSKVTYWVLSLIGCYILFRSYIPHKQRRKYFSFGLILLTLMFAYLALVTDSRFGEVDYGPELSGTQGGIVWYLGEPFVNFCFFYDNFTSPLINPGIVLPFITRTFFGGYGQTVDWQAYLSFVTNVRIGVFYTFLGAIKIGLGKIGMYIYLLILSVGGYWIVRPTKRQTLSLVNIYLYFLIATVPILGLFGHYYSSATKTFCVTLFFLFTHYVSRNRNKK